MGKTLKSLFFAALVAVCLPVTGFAAKTSWTLSSPDGKIKAEIKANGKVSYSITFKGKTILKPSEIAMNLDNGTVYGEGKVKNVQTGMLSRVSLLSLTRKLSWIMSTTR